MNARKRTLEDLVDVVMDRKFGARIGARAAALDELNRRVWARVAPILEAVPLPLPLPVFRTRRSS